MKYFSIFPSCKSTYGAKQACLTDLESGKYVLLPNSYAEIFEEEDTIEVNITRASIDTNDRKVFDDFLRYLEFENFGMFHNGNVDFLPLDKDSYEIPFPIISFIIDFKNFEGYRKKIENIDVIPKSIQLRLFFEPKITEVIQVLDLLMQRGFMNVELVTNLHDSLNISDLIGLVTRYNILFRIIAGNATKNKWGFRDKIYTTSVTFKDESQCGVITKNTFVINLDTYMMSQNCNSCLFKKISINSDGEVKNCPSMSKTYGNINNSEIKSILHNDEFKSLWKIKKDNIKVCRDCEYRNICTDCRAYIEDPEDIFSKPLKCGYDPYNTEWSEWSTHPLKLAAKQYYKIN